MFKRFIEKFLCMHDYIDTDMSEKYKTTNTYTDGTRRETVTAKYVLKCKKCGKIKYVTVEF